MKNNIFLVCHTERSNFKSIQNERALPHYRSVKIIKNKFHLKNSSSLRLWATIFSCKINERVVKKCYEGDLKTCRSKKKTWRLTCWTGCYNDFSFKRLMPNDHKLSVSQSRPKSCRMILAGTPEPVRSLRLKCSCLRISFFVACPGWMLTIIYHLKQSVTFSLLKTLVAETDQRKMNSFLQNDYKWINTERNAVKLSRYY